jgi:hypothetical protein
MELIPLACWKLNSVRFAFNSSFVLPETRKEFEELSQLRKAHPGAPLSVFGHADPVGDDTFNKKLSGRRADSIYAVLTRDTARWENLYSGGEQTEGWGIASVQQMLAALGYDVGPATGSMSTQAKKAVETFQGKSNLRVDGIAGPMTRARLFAAYMDFLCPDKIGKTEFLAQGADAGGKGDVQGCGEFNPVMIFSEAELRTLNEPENKGRRDAENAVNRRVLVLLFRPGTSVSPGKWPCPRTSEGVDGCQKRFWSDAEYRRSPRPDRREFGRSKDTFACRFYDRLVTVSPCEGVLAVPSPKKHWVQFKVVDERTGRPINGVQLHLQVPGGGEGRYVTSGKGTVRIENLDAGDCSIGCELNEPKLVTTRHFVGLGTAGGAEPVREDEEPLTGSQVVIATIEEHEVATGESLQLLADRAGMSWQALATFNWDTAVPKKINECLHDYVGCTKRSSDGQNYVFDDDDQPGVLCIPRPWSARGLATDREHVIRVKALDDFRVILETVNGHRLPEVKAKVKLADGKSRSVALGNSGIARIKNPPPGPVEVTYEDQDDMKAKALAAEARAAFDSRDTGEIYRILKHSPTMVRKALAAYDQYFNTLHGAGLVNDLYEEFVDPAALRVVVGMLARAGIETREKAVFVGIGDSTGDHFIYAAPELRAVIPGAEINYTCALRRSSVGPPGSGDEFEWYCLNNRASIHGDRGVQVVFGPKKSQWEGAKWSLIGDHTLICRVQYRSASGERRPPYYYEYPQAVEHAEAIASRHLGAVREQERPDPHQVLSSAKRVWQAQQEAESYAKAKNFPPLSSSEQERFDQRKESFERFIAKLDERVGDKQLRNKHYPIRAVHVDTNGQEMILRVCLRRALPEPLQYAPGIDDPQWELVDWTNPAVRQTTGVYRGTGKKPDDAIKDALATWSSGFRGNRYPKGLVKYEVLYGLLEEPVPPGTFETSGSSTLDDIAKFLGYGAGAAGIVALCLAPEPAASKVAAGAIYTAIFAGTASAVINIGQRYDEGFSNWREDGLDAFTIVGNCFGFAWMRGAQLSYAGKTYILVGRVGADAAQGVFLAESMYRDYDAIMEDATLSPDERTTRLLKFFGHLAATGAMMYLNFKGTKGDIEQLGAAGKTQIKLEDLANKGKTIVIEDKLPGLEGHTESKVKKTKIGTETVREPITAPKEPPDFKDKFPPDEKFWRIYDVDNPKSIHLQHARKGYEDFSQIDWAFYATWKKGTVKITVRTVERDGAGKLIDSSTWPDGSKCLVADDLYPMMFKHFEKHGLEIKAWEGPFAWKNYESVKKAMIGPPPLTPEEALLKGITAEKYWLPWAKSKGLKPKVVHAYDDEDSSLFAFRVEWVPQ